MIDLSDSNAWHKVTLNPPLTGAQLIAASKAVSGKSGDEHHQTDEHHNRPLSIVGRASEYLERNVVIAPVPDSPDQAPDSPYLDPQQTYNEVLAVHYYLPDAGPVIRPQGASLENVVRSLEEFGDDLQREAAVAAGLDAERERGVRPVQLSMSATRVPVTFDREATGRDVIAAVQASCPTDDMYGTKYYEAATSDGTNSGVVVGQSSGLEQHSLVVVPTDGSGFIDPDRGYDEVIVAKHHNPVPWQMRFPAIPGPEQKAAAVGEFAKQLDRNVRRGQQLADAGRKALNPTRSANARQSTSDGSRGDGPGGPAHDHTRRPGDNLSRG
ncbi:hypothetical protein GCM10009804_06590 [Kribbella hippodromi]|uniref:Uncharacterized protein n=1 Tax=Kribbella hippodromi TaxID=434347 RepID=A0ABN2C6F4_9ACTN